MQYQKGQNTPTEKDDINQNQIFFPKKVGETIRTEEKVISNEGVDDDYVISNSQNIKLNEKKVKEIVNSEKEEITPDIEDPIKIEESKNPKINNNQYQNRMSHKKSAIKQKIMWEEKNIYKTKNVNINRVYRNTSNSSINHIRFLQQNVSHIERYHKACLWCINGSKNWYKSRNFFRL